MDASFLEEKEGIPENIWKSNVLLTLLNSQTVPMIAFTCVYEKSSFGSDINFTNFKLFYP